MLDSEILYELKKMGDSQNRALEEFGIKTRDEFYGVPVSQLKAFAKKVKKNHELALRLWEVKVYEGKLLATLIEEPHRVAEEQINKQIKDIYSPDLADKFVNNIVSKTPFSVIKAQLWCNSPGEYEKRCGYMLLVSLAKHNKKLKNDFFERYLKIIIKEIHNERNWVKEAMNYALIAIGKRNKELYKKALETAGIIGKINIAYGNTACRPPDAQLTLCHLYSI